MHIVCEIQQKFIVWILMVLLMLTWTRLLTLSAFEYDNTIISSHFSIFNNCVICKIELSIVIRSTYTIYVYWKHSHANATWFSLFSQIFSKNPYPTTLIVMRFINSKFDLIRTITDHFKIKLPEVHSVQQTLVFKGWNNTKISKGERQRTFLYLQHKVTAIFAWHRGRELGKLVLSKYVVFVSFFLHKKCKILHEFTSHHKINPILLY